MQAERANSTSAPLPLFRAEALAARQQNAHGDILLIRPLSLVLLCWLGVLIAAGVIGFLLLGHYTEKIQVKGVVTPSQAGAPELAVLFTVPTAHLNTIRPGRALLVRCPACARSFRGTITSISGPTHSQPDISRQTNVASAMTELRVTIAAAPQDSALPPGARLEADVPIGSKRLIQWLLEKPGS